jgi:hypothetical protein
MAHATVHHSRMLVGFKPIDDLHREFNRYSRH